MDPRLKEVAKQAGIEAAKAIAKPAAKALGDQMEKSKRPFWRWLVGLFRGGK